MDAQKAWFTRLMEYELAALSLDLPQCVATATKRTLTVLLMLAVAWLIGSLPGADAVLYRRITVTIVLRLGIAVAAIVLLVAAYRRMVCVLGHMAQTLFHIPSGEMAPAGSVSKLAWSVTLLLYIALIYWAVLQTFPPILDLLTSRRWPIQAINIASLAAAVAAIAGIFAGALPLFGRAGDSLARQVTAEPPPVAPQMAPQSKCPQCGVLYDAGAKFCAFCGRALPPAESKPAAGD